MITRISKSLFFFLVLLDARRGHYIIFFFYSKSWWNDSKLTERMLLLRTEKSKGSSLDLIKGSPLWNLVYANYWTNPLAIHIFWIKFNTLVLCPALWGRVKINEITRWKGFTYAFRFWYPHTRTLIFYCIPDRFRLGYFIHY